MGLTRDKPDAQCGERDGLQGDASSGQFGPRVPAPDDADVQTRLLGFIVRDPLRGRE